MKEPVAPKRYRLDIPPLLWRRLSADAKSLGLTPQALGTTLLAQALRDANRKAHVPFNQREAEHATTHIPDDGPENVYQRVHAARIRDGVDDSSEDPFSNPLLGGNHP